MSDASIGALDMSEANAALFAALAKAQQAAATVGKDAKNTQRGYNYASAEAMVRAARKAMEDTGLAVLSTWTQTPAELPEGGDIGNQFACATVIEHFVITHADGGYIRGRAEIDAIASRARPYDKAVAAAATYMHGFVLRHLLNLDRAEEGEAAVDQRGEEGFTPNRRARQQPPREGSRKVTPAESPARKPPRNKAWQAGQALFGKVASRRESLIAQNREALAKQGVTTLSTEQMVAKALGVEGEPPHKYDIPADQWGVIVRAFGDDIDDLEMTLAEEGPEEAAQ